eukprot:s180_g4.t1
MALPNEYVPGTARPTVNVVPNSYVLTSDSALAFITGKGRTLKNYTLEKDFEAKKAVVVPEFSHQMLWGKDLRRLVKANIEKIKELMSKYSSQYSSQIRVISIVVWSGNELCGESGIEPLPVWGQDNPEGDNLELMAEVKKNFSWWNTQLKELGVDQAALVGEPDHAVYGLGLVFTSWMAEFKQSGTRRRSSQPTTGCAGSRTRCCRETWS